MAAAGLVIGGMTPLGVWLIAPLEERFIAPAELGQVDGIVVLGGAERSALTAAHGQPHVNHMSGRLITFLHLARAYPEARLVHSGRGWDVAGPSGGLNQSLVAERLLLDAGIDPSRIRFERRSLNTCENARMSFELVRPTPGERWLLVTSAFHMPRAMGCFQTVGWSVIPYPTDYKQRREFGPLTTVLPDNLSRLDLAAHEWGGLVYYRLRGYTESLFPGP